MMAMPVEQRVSMGRSGQDFARREFDRDTLVDRLERQLEQLVDGSGRRDGAAGT
ncbi:hypothetical protein D3C87_2139780 [compost metagenome]